MKKRVAVIIPGGIGSGLFNQGIPALVNLIDGLSKEFDITVYSLVAISPEFKTDKYQIKAINASFEDWTVGRVIRLTRMILKDHRKKKYNLFHGFWGIPCGTMAVMLGKLFKRPSIVSLQGGEAANVPSINYGYLINEKKAKRLHRTLRAATKVTALTKFQRDLLVNHGFDNIEFEVIPYGVDTSLFKSSSKSYEEPINFIHVANLTEVKDQATMLRTFRKLKVQIDCRLFIIGEDGMDGKIQNLSRDLGIVDDVELVGYIPNEQLPEYFARAQIMLHTSLYEAQTVSVVEAMASKILVAGTEAGIMSDLEQFFITAPFGDYEQLATKIIDTLARPELTNAKLDQALTWAERYDINTTVSNFNNLYNQLMEQ